MKDISNIRVTEIGNTYLSKLVDEQGIFKEDIAVARFALGYAISKNLDTGINDDSTINATLNKWDVGGFDPDGSLKLLIESRHPLCECPYRIIQVVMNMGLEMLSQKTSESGFVTISDFLGD